MRRKYAANSPKVNNSPYASVWRADGDFSGARTFQSAATLEGSTIWRNSLILRLSHVAAGWKVRAPITVEGGCQKNLSSGAIGGGLYDATSRRADSSVSISFADLSVRIRTMRGKRMANPLLWRVLGWIRSKATSKTMSGWTSR